MNEIKNDIAKMSKSLEVISTNSTKIVESVNVKECKDEFNKNEVLPYLTIIFVALIFSFTVLSYTGKLGHVSLWVLGLCFGIPLVAIIVYMICCLFK